MSCEHKVEIGYHVSEWMMTIDGGNGPRIEVEVAGLRFPNPLLLASGITDETGMSMAEAVRSGAGGVVTKSLSIDPRDGHPNPCIVDLPFGMINAMGLPNPGIPEYEGEIRTYLEMTGGTNPIIASVFGSTIEEYSRAASMVSKMGVHGIEINGSCPNAKGLGLQFGQEPDVIRELVSSVRTITKLPLFFKLTPNTQNINSLALAAQEGGADGLVAINTLQAMKIDVYTGRPVLTNRTGGLSGPAIRPVGVRCVYSIASDPDIVIPIIAVGGVTDHMDVMEYLMAGARAVQVGTSVSWCNLSVFSKIKNGIESFMEEQDLVDINEVVGAALEVRD